VRRLVSGGDADVSTRHLFIQHAEAKKGANVGGGKGGRAHVCAAGHAAVKDERGDRRCTHSKLHHFGVCTSVDVVRQLVRWRAKRGWKRCERTCELLGREVERCPQVASLPFLSLNCYHMLCHTA
jgi:hypothetical protein